MAKLWTQGLGKSSGGFAEAYSKAQVAAASGALCRALESSTHTAVTDSFSGVIYGCGSKGLRWLMVIFKSYSLLFIIILFSLYILYILYIIHIIHIIRISYALVGYMHPGSSLRYVQRAASLASQAGAPAALGRGEGQVDGRDVGKGLRCGFGRALGSNGAASRLKSTKIK